MDIETIRENILNCDFILVLIGGEWLSALKERRNSTEFAFTIMLAT